MLVVSREADRFHGVAHAEELLGVVQAWDACAAAGPEVAEGLQGVGRQAVALGLLLARSAAQLQQEEWKICMDLVVCT